MSTQDGRSESAEAEVLDQRAVGGQTIDASGDQPTPRWRRMGRRLLDRPLSHVVLGAAGVVLLITASLGGLADAATRQATKIPVGTTVTAEPFALNVTKAVLTDDPGGAIPAAPDGQAYLLVGVTIATTQNVPTGGFALRDVARVTDVAGIYGNAYAGELAPDPAQVPGLLHLVADGSLINPVGPDLNYEGALLWRVADPNQVGEVVTVELFEHRWRQNHVDFTQDWMDPTPVGEVAVPVVRRLTAEAAP